MHIRRCAAAVAMVAATSAVVSAAPGDFFAGPANEEAFFSGGRNQGMASGWTSFTSPTAGGYRSVNLSSAGLLELQSPGNPGPEDWLNSYVYAMNSAGYTVGVAQRAPEGSAGGYRPVRWDSAGNVEELGILGVDSAGATHGVVHDINEAGVAVGQVEDHSAGPTIDLGTRPIRWNPGSAAPIVYETLNTAPNGSTVAEIYDINESNVSTGYADQYSAEGDFLGVRAVRWDADGNIEELGALQTEPGGFTETRSLAINNAGTVLGTALYADLTRMQAGSFPVVWEAGSTTPTMLRVPDTAFEVFDPEEDPVVFYLSGEAEAINNNGVVIGNFNVWTGDPANQVDRGPRAYVWTDAAADPIELPIPNISDDGEGYARARGITDSGVVVGQVRMYFEGGLSESLAAVWTPDHQLKLLHELVDLPRGWHYFSDILAITNDGWITGIGLYQADAGSDPYERHFLLHLDLSTVPEPGTAALAGLAIISLLRRRRSR